MITFTNKELESYVMFKLGKNSNNFKKNDLKKIKELYINPINIGGEYNYVNLEEINNFPSLEVLSISNMHLDIAVFAYITRLENLNTLILISCTFEDLSILSNLKIKNIEFYNSSIENIGIINRINSLEGLTLIGYKDIDLSYFFNLNLKKLNITNSTLLNIKDLEGFKNISILNINNSNIMELSFLNRYKDLEELYITKTQYLANKILIDSLNKNIKIIIDNIFPFNGGVK